MEDMNFLRKNRKIFLVKLLTYLSILVYDKGTFVILYILFKVDGIVPFFDIKIKRIRVGYFKRKIIIILL